MTKLSIIILSYNTALLTQKCLDSLFSYYHDEIRNKNFEVIVVDNSSSDDTVTLLKKSENFSHIRLIENKTNDGFSKGNNIGVSYAKGEYILFLNSDTTFENNKLIEMLDYLQKHTDIGILGGRLRNTDGSYQPSAGVFYTFLPVVLLLLGAERLGKLRYSPQEITEVDWLSGAMMMVNKEFFKKIGGFDEKLFMYMEDMELCFRVKKYEKKVVFYPKATIEHMSHGSSNRSFAIVQIYKGIVYFYRKHQSAIAYASVKGLLLLKAYVLVVFGTISGNSVLKQTYTKAAKAI